jgi:hypothetical protein
LQQGEKLSLSVDFNTDAISNAFQYDIEYDTSVLRLLSVSGGSYNEYADGKIRYVAVGNSKTDNAVFVFYTKSAVTTDIKFTNICSANTKEYSYPDVTYSVTIDTATRGDVNNDGNIDTTDLAELKLYLAGITSDVNAFADYDCNGSVDTSDLAALKLYLAGV